MIKILIIGAGAWGTALTHILAKNNSNVFIWSRNKNISNEINLKKTNSKYFPKKKLSKNIRSIYGNISTDKFDYIFYVLPASIFTTFSKKYLLGKKISNLILCSKGVTSDGKFLSDVAEKNLNINNLFYLSGPSFADEVINGKMTALSMSSLNKSKKIGNLFKGSNIRIYFSKNLKSLEYLSIYKNAYAIGAGIIDSIKLGNNAKAAYITRCISEIKKSMKYLKLETSSINSLGGLGDIILSCNSSKSRNYSYGYNLINKRHSKTKKTIEGLNTCLSFSKNKKIRVNNQPILNSIINIINGSSPNKEIEKLFTRNFKSE